MSPVEAVRWRKGVNAQKVGDLVRSVRPNCSFNNLLGPLEFLNDGPSFIVNDGDWVVIVAGRVVVMADDLFNAHFAPEGGAPDLMQ